MYHKIYEWFHVTAAEVCYTSIRVSEQFRQICDQPSHATTGAGQNECVLCVRPGSIIDINYMKAFKSTWGAFDLLHSWHTDPIWFNDGVFHEVNGEPSSIVLFTLWNWPVREVFYGLFLWANFSCALPSSRWPFTSPLMLFCCILHPHWSVWPGNMHMAVPSFRDVERQVSLGSWVFQQVQY